MYLNVHTLAILSTIVLYFLLRSFKNDNVQNKSTNKKQSNLIYILFAPAVVYITYYVLLNKDKTQSPGSQIKIQAPNGPVQQIPQTPQIQIKTPSSDLPSIYPVESTLSSGL
jgi:predicted neutral ceramidase superfamily lipid hydrolase